MIIILFFSQLPPLFESPYSISILFKNLGNNRLLLPFFLNVKRKYHAFNAIYKLMQICTKKTEVVRHEYPNIQ